MSLISELQKVDAWDDSVNLMAKYVREYPENSTVVRLKLAEILMKKLKRPAQAQKVLSEVDQTKLEANTGSLTTHCGDKLISSSKKIPTKSSRIGEGEA